MSSDAATKSRPKENKKRAVIYARYSTKGQREVSIEDQITLCRNRVASDPNISVVKTYADHAKSGAGMLNRDELNDMLKAADAGEFDMLILESLDRLARDPEHLHGIWKGLRFGGVEVLTCNEGQVSTLLVALRGIVGEMQLKDTGDKVRRHHEGRAREGKIPGALSYGYRLVRGKAGEREIDPEQAKIVRRVFEQYAAGLSPRAICEQLNNERIPSPSANQTRKGKKLTGHWLHTTISNGRGFLANRVYIGEIIWNRQQGLRHPIKETRVRRERDQSEWIITQAPQLRIIEQPLWDAVQKMVSQRKRGGGTAKGRIVARKSGLLSGLVRCAACGADMRMNGGDPPRVVCSAAGKSAQLCTHRRSYEIGRIEKETIEYVRDIFSDPKRVQEFLTEFERRLAAKQRQARDEMGVVKKRRTEIEASIRRLMYALESGGMPEDILYPRLRELEAERVALEDRRRIADANVAKVVWHPATLKKWYA